MSILPNDQLEEVRKAFKGTERVAYHAWLIRNTNAKDKSRVLSEIGPGEQKVLQIDGKRRGKTSRGVL